MGRITPTDLAVDALAAYRLTRLVTTDEITAPLRARVKMRAARELDSPGAWEKVETLLSCPWCVGWYVACGVTVARRVCPRWWSPVAAALAMSAVTGLLAENT